MSSLDDQDPVDCATSARKPDAIRLHLASHGIVLTPPALSELEIAMLELVEFGVDRWAATSSTDVAAGLVSRGLLRVVDIGPDASSPTQKIYGATEKGRKALFAATAAGKPGRARAG